MIDPGRIVEQVAQRLQQHRERLREYFASGPVPPGMEPVSDEQFMEFVLGQIELHPPQLLMFPMIGKDGLPELDRMGQPSYDPRMVSPWIAMLGLKKRDENGKPTNDPLVVGGDVVLARIERLAAAGIGGT